MRIENRLRKLAIGNPSYGLLLAQWEFDKKLLTRALNTVGRDFPHYSLHDASHSSTIITQIEKVISKDIEYLSATDCFLILESCYWHDSGMIISDSEKIDLLKSAEFQSFILQEKENSSEISEYIRLINSTKDTEDSLDLYEKSKALTFILADYFRKQHAERSGSYVIDPQRIQIMSPRTSLIPSRLFHFVAEIVSCHGRNREDILKIAKCNDGMDSDDYAHPRYIAALLRIGDLLDIDDGRFCQTMLASIGKVPLSSIAHQHKHASIKHLYIDSNVIEIKSLCPDYESFEHQSQWFDYLKNELRYQSENWNDISPDKNYSSLPVIKDLTCKIDGYMDIDGKAPQIKLYNKRVYEYLSGNLIYSEKFPFLRESIQNSIDSIYHKIWRNYSKLYNWNSLSDEHARNTFNEKLELESINIKISKVELSDNEIKYLLEIQDEGLGISFEDIKKILNVGSPLSKSQAQQKSGMADWAKPSGFFGLGMQSIFKMSNYTTISTRTADGEQYEFSTSLSDDGRLKIKIKKVNDINIIGTNIKINFSYIKVPNTISFSQIDYLKNYDPIKDELLEVIPSIFEELIKENFFSCRIPIYLNGSLLNPKDEEVLRKYHTNFELGMNFNLQVDLEKRYSEVYAFKGVPFESKISINGIVGYYDIFSDDASYWLTIDRKKQNPKSYNELYKKAQDLIEKEYEKIIANSESKEAADFYFYSLYGKQNCTSWSDFLINNRKVEDYFEKGLELIITDLSDSYGKNQIETEIYTHELKSRLIGSLVDRLNLSFSIAIKSKEIYSRSGQSIEYNIYGINFNPSAKGDVSVSIEVINQWLTKVRNNGCARSTVPLYDIKYKEISIEKQDLEPWIYCRTEFTGWFSNFLLLPIKGKSKDVDLEDIFKYYERKNKNKIEKSRFIELYNEFWDEISDV
ncbi:TPA: HD domain-containing protein [Providencia alcalifaciens]